MPQRSSQPAHHGVTGRRSAVDPAAAGVVMFGFGPAGMRVIRRWMEQQPPGAAVIWAAASRADVRSLGELQRLVEGSAPGRLMLAGPETDVAAARALAGRLGLADSQVRWADTDGRPGRADPEVA